MIGKRLVLTLWLFIPVLVARSANAQELDIERLFSSEVKETPTVLERSDTSLNELERAQNENAKQSIGPSLSGQLGNKLVETMRKGAQNSAKYQDHLCFAIKDKDYQNACVAIKQQDRTRCFAIKSKTTQNDCLANVDQDESYCFSIGSQNLRNSCLASVRNNDSLCYSLRSKDLKNHCVATAKHQESLCYSVKSTNLQNYCIGLTN